jgi:hypothetical protein
MKSRKVTLEQLREANDQLKEANTEASFLLDRVGQKKIALLQLMRKADSKTVKQFTLEQ